MENQNINRRQKDILIPQGKLENILLFDPCYNIQYK